MHLQSRPPGTTTYLVTVERTQAAGLEVVIDGPDSPEGRATALDEAKTRLGAREAVAWTTVGDPAVIGVAPVDEPAGAVA